MQTAKICGFEFDGHAAALLVVLHRFVDKRNVSGEIRGQRFNAFLFLPAR